MEAHNHSHNHSTALKSIGTAFVVGTVLNAVFVTVEFVAGYRSGSMGLLSDAGHNLGDVASLVLAWIAFRMTRIKPNRRYTYGLSRSTVLVSLTNAAILLIAVGMIVIESIRKFRNPQPLDEDVVIWVAAIGVVINFATALMFVRGGKQDLNIKGAFLHMAMDALVSVGVVVSGIVIKYTGWYVVDPAIGIAIAVIILISTWGLLRRSIRLSLDGVPEEMNIDTIEHYITTVEGVESVHHIHVWALGTSKTALTAHITVADIAQSEHIKTQIRQRLSEHGISHCTIETEPRGYHCCESRCEEER